MYEKWKFFEPALEKEELGHSYRETETEWQDKRARCETVSVSEVKGYEERKHGQTKLRRCKQPSARVCINCQCCSPQNHVPLFLPLHNPKFFNRQYSNYNIKYSILKALVHFDL